MDNWQDFKKSFTQKQEDAIWQYIIDHSQVQKNGYLGIQLYVRDIDDFWKRIYARYTGDFQRYDKLEKQKLQDDRFIHVYKKIANKNGQRAEHIDRNGSWIEKAVLWIHRKSRDYIFGKY